MKDEQKILIGKIVAPQGIRGEVRVQSFVDKPTDFKTLSVVSNRFSSADFQFVRAVPNSNVVIAKIRGVDDRNAAETLRGTELFVERSALPDLQSENVFYQADLIGFEVIRDRKNIGKVAGFQNFGAGDIIELGDGSMVSFIGATVDMENKFIYVI